MGILKRNKNIIIENDGPDLVNGFEFIIKRALNNGIGNIFLESALISRLPEVPLSTSVQVRNDSSMLWESAFTLGITNRRFMGFATEGSFFNFSAIDKHFIGNKNLSGGVVAFLFKDWGINKISSKFKGIFPTFSYFRIKDFIEYLPYYFELSEKLKLPVLIYLNDSILNEYNPEEKKEYTERTAAKAHFNLANANGNDTEKQDKTVKQDIQLFKNTGKHVMLFKGESPSNLFFTSSEYFPRLIENNSIAKNSDIILFNLLNPIDFSALKEILEKEDGGQYTNAYICDDTGFIRRAITNANLNELEGYKRFLNLNTAGSACKEITGLNFCMDRFEMTETKTLSSFCPGCGLFAFLQAIEKMAGGEGAVASQFGLIGDNGCFKLIEASALKFSFENISFSEEPVYFSMNMRSKDLDKKFFVFVPIGKFLEKLHIYSKITSEPELKDRIVFVIYKTIYDLSSGLEELLSNPIIKPLKKAVVKGGARLKEIGAALTASLIIIDNDCQVLAKSGRNLNYTGYLEINNAICDKTECKLCLQKTKCPAIKINGGGEITIDPESCALCWLCRDICQNNGIKYKKRKKIKIKKSLESKIKI